MARRVVDVGGCGVRPIDHPETVVRAALRFCGLEFGASHAVPRGARAAGATAWDLRCYVRERLIAYLQEHHPQALPHGRTQVEAVFERSEITKPEGCQPDVAQAGSY